MSTGKLWHNIFWVWLLIIICTCDIYGQDSPVVQYITDKVVVTTLAGSDIAGNKDGIGSEAQFDKPNGGYYDKNGFVWVADIDQDRVAKISSLGAVTSSQGGLIKKPIGLCVDAEGFVYVASTNNYILKMRSDGSQITVIAGNTNGVGGHKNGSALDALFSFPNDMVNDSLGNLFFTEFYNHTIRKLTPDGQVSIWVGNGMSGYQDGERSQALLSQPAGIAIDREDNLYITEWSGHRIRKINTLGQVSTLAGGTNTSLNAGYSDGKGTDARFNTPDGIAVDLAGNIFIAESGTHCIRRIFS